MDVKKSSNIFAGRTLQRWTPVSTSVAGIGDNSIVAAPGATSELVLKGLRVIKNAATDVTVVIKLGTVQITVVMNSGLRDTFDLAFEVGDEWFCGQNQPVIVNLSAAVSCGIVARYMTLNYVA
jgi:hypothetical protein